jgi:magnesium transporter
VGETIEGFDTSARERVAALRRSGTFFWIDVAVGELTPGDLGKGLEIPEEALRPLFNFGEASGHPRKFHADGRHVVFSLTCYLEAGPEAEGSQYALRAVEVHVLVTGDYLLTLHQEHVSLPERLAPTAPEGGSEQYVVYAILDAMVASAFDALTEAEMLLEELQGMSADLGAGRVRMTTLRLLNQRLSEMRRRTGPQRGVFERISVEIGRLESLGADSERYFERIGGQLNRLVEAIDAAADAMTRLIDLRLNETNYVLTVVATVFLPLTFVTGFFGMNFGWMVGEIHTELAFWLLGIGTLVVGVALIWLLVIRGTPVQRDEDRADAAPRFR